MREESDFIKDVEVVARVLEMQGKDNPQKEGKKLYRKYKETKNDAVRLAVALRGFFVSEGISQEQREEFGGYIRAQIVPAVLELIEEEDVEKIGTLEEMGWFTGEQVELFIRTARERHKTAALVWLMHLKDKKYGYAEEEFFLW